MNCFFYDEDIDMGARIPFCSYTGSYGQFKCEGCEYCISRETVKELVKKYIKEKKIIQCEEPTHEQVRKYCERRNLTLIYAAYLRELYKKASRR